MSRRNARCACGSGKKYRNCCGQTMDPPNGTGVVILPAFTYREDGTLDAHTHTMVAPSDAIRELEAGGLCDWCNDRVEATWIRDGAREDGALLVVDDGELVHSALVHYREMAEVSAALSGSRPTALGRLRNQGHCHPENPDLADQVHALSEALHGKEVILDRRFRAAVDVVPRYEEL